MNILVIGAYGLIGSGISQRLELDGHKITGLGRDTETGQRVLPNISWRSGDLRALTEASAWHPVLENIDVVVNCSGALQDGPQDDLEAVHHLAIAALATACKSANVRIVQISAVGVSLDSPIPFLATKARGDEAIRNAGVQYHIFKPGLVLAQHSYGGSTLLRMLAAIPFVQPIALPHVKIQTVSLTDVAAAVSAAITCQIPCGFEGDLVEQDAHSLRDVVSSMRRFLGFGEVKYEISIPGPVMKYVTKVADGLAWLGWRSPLRSTSVKILSGGITGGFSDLSKYGVSPVKSLSQTLTEMPARTEDRLSARMALLSPIIIATLAIFWFLSGAIGLLRANDAAQILVEIGWPRQSAVASVVFWAVMDIAIAAAFAYRPSAKLACWLAIGVSLFYLATSTVFVPSLWLEPLGPLVKVLPGIVLALVGRIALETR